MRTSAKALSSISKHRVGWCFSLVLILLLFSGCLRTASRTTSFEEDHQRAPEPKVEAAGSKKAKERTKPQSDANHYSQGTEKHPISSGKKTAARKMTQRQDAALKKRLQKAAVQLARSIGAVRKIKLCYDQKADEWWLILYKELDTAVDVKQFFWSWEREEFAPFLVIKRISKNKLTEDVTKSEAGRTCSELPAPSSDPDDPFEKFWGRGVDFESR